MCIGLGALAILAGAICIAQPPTQALRYPLPGANSAPAPSILNQPALKAAADQPPPDAVLFQPGQIVARVSDKTILYGDVAPTASLIFALATTETERQSLKAQYPALIKSLVMQAVQSKMLLLAFERSIPGEIRSDAKKRADGEVRIRKDVRATFDKALIHARERVANASDEQIDELMAQDPTIVRLALLMQRRGLLSAGELDIALREMGMTLQQQVDNYGEHMMGMQAVREKLGYGRHKKLTPITHEEMLDYYWAHESDFRVPAKASFEILSARFSRFNGDHQAAHAHAAMMGNDVFLGGVPFAAVAKKHSQEPLAENGGQYENITPGSLASKTIDNAVFTLEIGKLSQIIEDDLGYHILRVKQRTPASVVSFLDAQSDIRERIEAQKMNAERQKYLTELKARTKIWTIYDPPPDDNAAP